MQMEVPHFLVARRLVVLMKRYALASINLFHCKSNFLSDPHNVGKLPVWYVINILKMSAGDDQHISRITRPPPW